MKDPEGALFRVAISLTAAWIAAGALLDWSLR